MAIRKDYTDPATQLTVPNAYYRVVGFRVSLIPAPMVAVVVGVYATQAARQAGANPIRVIEKGLNADASEAFVGMAALKTLLGRIYAAVLKTDPDYQGGTDVSDQDG